MRHTHNTYRIRDVNPKTTWPSAKKHLAFQGWNCVVTTVPAASETCLSIGPGTCLTQSLASFLGITSGGIQSDLCIKGCSATYQIIYRFLWAFATAAEAATDGPGIPPPAAQSPAETT